MFGYGTLGTKWNPWKQSAAYDCSHKNCGVLHSTQADVIVFGQCRKCATYKNKLLDIPEKRIDLFECTFKSELKRKMLCGHNPVGMSSIWVHLKKEGVLEFTLQIECYNCDEDPSALLAFKESGVKTIETRATPCCDKPMLNFVGLRAKWVPEGSHFELMVKQIRFTHDSCSSRFRHGQHSGMFVENTRRELFEGITTPAQLPKADVFAKGNRFYSLGNRRLAALKKAESDRSKSRKRPLGEVPVRLEQNHPKKWKSLTTKNEGKSIVVRGVGVWP